MMCDVLVNKAVWLAALNAEGCLYFVVRYVTYLDYNKRVKKT